MPKGVEIGHALSYQATHSSLRSKPSTDSPIHSCIGRGTAYIFRSPFGPHTEVYWFWMCISCHIWAKHPGTHSQLHCNCGGIFISITNAWGVAVYTPSYSATH